ncbi:MAG: nucleotide sugar dehydrogenase, partial [Bacteroidota bacterium]
MLDISKLFLSKRNSILDALKIQENAIKYNLPKGLVIVVNDDQKLIGTVTDGDIRRAMLNGRTLKSPISDMMQTNPISFPDNWSTRKILKNLPSELQKRDRNSRNFLGKIIITNEQSIPIKVVEYHQLWEYRMALHRHISVIGLGYVGLTLALALADAGFKITGIDIDKNKLDQLDIGKSYIHEVGLPELLREHIHTSFFVSADIPSDSDVFIISVGTPILQSNDRGLDLKPNMNFLEAALQTTAPKLRPGSLVILRSTVPVGTCRNYVIPMLEKLSGLKCGFDFHLAFAPERTAEGKAIKELRSLPQIIGGYNEDSTDATGAIFKELTPTIVRVDSLEAAEMVKLINNSFRDYVFAYSNFIAQVAGKFNLNINEVLWAANERYPRNKVPFPSPGVGGPCLTKDPFIFSSVVESLGMHDHLFKMSRHINESMHQYIVEQLEEQLHKQNKKIKNTTILICGLAFKGQPETGDIRNSSSVLILKELEKRGACVFGYDPVATDEDLSLFDIKKVNIPRGFKDMEVVMFLNNHKSFEKIDVFSMVRKMAVNPIIYDGWNLFH